MDSLKPELGRSTPFVPLAFIWLTITIAVVAYRGMQAFPEGYLAICLPFKYPGRFGADPLVGEVLAKVAPVVFSLFGPVYDVPLTHLLGGILCKAALCAAFLYYAWTLTRSPLACVLSVVFLFGLSRWDGVVGVRFPIGAMDTEIWDPMYLSARQLGMACILGAAGFILAGRGLSAGLLLGLGTHFHALNAMAAFLCFSLGLLLYGYAQAPRERLEALRMGSGFAGAFLLMALPRILAASGMFRDVAPISVAEFWRFGLHNEPDDVSALYLFTGERGSHTWREIAVCVSMLAACFVPAVRSRLSPGFLKNPAPGAPQLLPCLLAAPLLITGLAAVWETVLLPRLPDFLNDILIPLQFRRYLSLSAIPASPVAAVILVLGGYALLDKLRDRSIRPSRILTEPSLAMSLAALVAVVYLGIGRSNLRLFPFYLSMEHKRYDYFLKLQNPEALAGPVYSNEPSDQPAVPLSDLIEACEWIKANTPPSAGFFSPSYIRQFRGFCERPAFVTEKHDAGVAITNRRYATLFLRRFEDLHRKSFMDIPGPIFAGGPPYAIMRRQHLSLTAADLERLKTTYPGFSYLLTEPGRSLPYPLVHANAHLAVYNLSEAPAKGK